jgi:3(or 17)beta-hydroxysteroid dehydrogenase
MRTLSNKVAIVTGGASGLGRAIAARLVTDGAAVVITDVQAELAKQVATELGCDHLRQDVTDEARWDAVIDLVNEGHGGLDILVNNAGILGPALNISPEDTSFADWKKVMSVNVDGVFLGCRAGIRAMRKSGRGGSIINIASIAGERATPYATAYGASKATVGQLTRSVAQHCAQEQLNIRCNAVHPGNVYTPLHDRRAAEWAAARGVTVEEVLVEVERCPLGGWIPIEQIAAAVSYLASDEARYVTGTKLVVDGGTLGCDTFRRVPNVSST